MLGGLLQMQDKAREVAVQFHPWMEECTFIMVTEENLSEVIDVCINAGLYALDLETTGLNVSVYNGETVDKIVGICLAADSKTGYYIPIRHEQDDCNVKWSLVHQEMSRLIDSEAIPIFHNGKFDQEFLQFNGVSPLGEWDEPTSWEDTLIMAYLDDSKRSLGQMSLKYLAKEMLDRPMISLKDLCKGVGKDWNDGINFAEFDPLWEPTITYGASDAVCTFALYEYFHPRIMEVSAKKDKIHKQKTCYEIERGTVAATRWMERARVRVDMDKLEELIRIGHRDWMASLTELYQEIESHLGRDARPGWFRVFQGELGDRFQFDPDNVDRLHGIDLRIEEAKDLAKRRGLDLGLPPVTKSVPHLKIPKQMEMVSFPAIYDVSSSAQLGDLLRELGVRGLESTATGKVATSADVLDRLISRVGTKYSYMSKVSRFRSIQKALTTYLIPLYEDAREEWDQGDKIWTVRVGFNAHSADTGRFVASTSRANKRSSIKVTDGGTRVTFHGLPSGYDASKPECLLRIKEVFIPRKGKINVASDYSGVELRVVTALSGEPTWANEYYRCSDCSHEFDRPATGQIPTWIPPFCPSCGSDKIGDIHTLTAQAIYGKNVVDRPDFKELRQNSKGVNFALCYGGSGKAVERATGVSEQEGSQIKGKFDQAYTVLQGWWAHSKAHAHTFGYVRTAFGRNCSMRPYIWLPKTPDNRAAIAKAERNACNAPVQGTSADITKSAMFYVYRECKKRDWLDKVHMLATIHDELVFEVDLDILEEALELIQEQMTNHRLIRHLKWPVPIVIDTDIGFDWKCKWKVSTFALGKKPWPDEIKPYFKKPWLSYDAPPSAGLPEGTRLKLVIGGDQEVLDENGYPTGQFVPVKGAASSSVVRAVEVASEEAGSDAHPSEETTPHTNTQDESDSEVSDSQVEEKRSSQGPSDANFEEVLLEPGYYDIPSRAPAKADILIKELGFHEASGLGRALEYGMLAGMQTELSIKGPGSMDLTQEVANMLGVEKLRANYDALFRVLSEYDGIVLRGK